MDTDNIMQLYKHAVLTIVWTVKDGYRELIFAAVDMVQAFKGDACGTEEIGVKVQNRRLFYKRHLMTVGDGLKWYENAIHDNELTMPWQPQTKIYLCPHGAQQPRYVLSPKWPNRLYRENYPFSPLRDQGVRVSSYMAAERLLSLEDFISNVEVSEWISARLMCPLNENLEYLGSVNLAFPNPYYCRSRMRLTPTASANASDFVTIYFDRDCSSDNLQVVLQERINKGYASLRRVPVTGSSVKMDLMGTSDEVSYSVVDESGELLDWQDFAPFIREINIDYGIVSRTSGVLCKDGVVQYCNKTCHQDQVLKDETIQLPEIVLHNKIATLGYARDLRNRAKGQFIYGDNRGGEAERKIREIVNKARRRLLIIDPYCSSRTAEMYFPYINPGVQLIVYCTRKGLDDRGERGTLADECARFQSVIDDHVKSGGTAKVYVCDKSALHDRFILVDDADAWLLGSSLETLGDSLSVIVRLENGAYVVHALEDALAKCRQRTLEDIRNNVADGE